MISDQSFARDLPGSADGVIVGEGSASRKSLALFALSTRQDDRRGGLALFAVRAIAAADDGVETA
jgi:hypothetical protein